MKNFDWNIHVKRRTNTKAYLWLRLNYKKVISEDEFVKKHQELRQYSTSKNGVYSPSKLKRNYKKLKENYGFFTGKLI
jgi:hypothetical protein